MVCELFDWLLLLFVSYKLYLVLIAVTWTVDICIGYQCVCLDVGPPETQNLWIWGYVSKSCVWVREQILGYEDIVESCQYALNQRRRVFI